MDMIAKRGKFALLFLYGVWQKRSKVYRPVDALEREAKYWIMEKNTPTSVLFNANCPVCNFEIQHYAQYADKKGLPIRFDDLNTDARNAWGLDADTAARRLYVLHEGEMTSGIPAFLILWAQMPRYKWLARIVGLPIIKQTACAIYDYVLAPLIYRWHLRRIRKYAKPK